MADEAFGAERLAEKMERLPERRAAKQGVRFGPEEREQGIPAVDAGRG